jgi:hypothetical protein
MKLRTAALSCVALTFLGGTLPAAAADGKWTLGLSGGTYGVGPELAYRLGSHAGLRASAGYFSVDQGEELDDIDYDGEIDLNSIGAALDLYPFGGGFRVSLGARINNNEINLEGRPSTNVEIGNVTYTPAQVGSLTGKVTTDSFAPTLAIGYGGKLAEGFTMGFELGVMFQGSPKIEDLRATNGTLASNPLFLANLAEEERRMEEDAEDFKYWPVLQLQFLYRF